MQNNIREVNRNPAIGWFTDNPSLYTKFLIHGFFSRPYKRSEQSVTCARAYNKKVSKYRYFSDIYQDDIFCFFFFKRVY